jgi:cysteine desulfurase
MTHKRIYLDFNASTPVDPDVAVAMQPLLTEAFGNPSSSHWAGVPARRTLAEAREHVATLLGCTADEVVFTSGGSEANNAVLKGLWFAKARRGSHIVTTAIEHPAVLEPCRFLESLGASVTRVRVDRFGLVDPDDIQRSLRPETFVVSVMHANNEVGTIQPIAEIGRVTRERGIPFHTDAAQTAGKIGIHVDELSVDFLSIAGHKLYAPKGVGALFVRKGRFIEPLIHGGSHERGLRAGTESALLATGLGAASRLAVSRSDLSHVRTLRDRLWKGLRDRLGDRVILNGHPELRLPNTLNVSFIGRTGAEVLANLDHIAASTGSACHTGAPGSPVLQAMGIPRDIASGAVRFSLGHTTTPLEIDQTLEEIAHLFE